MTTTPTSTFDPCSDWTFYYPNHPFCEGLYTGSSFVWHYGGHTGVTELVSCLTNVAYLFMGGWCLAMGRGSDQLLGLCNTLLLAVGFSSTLYHGTLWRGFGLLDGISMVLLATCLALASAALFISACWPPDTTAANRAYGLAQILVVAHIMAALQQKSLGGEPGDIVWLSAPVVVCVMCMTGWCKLHRPLPGLQLRDIHLLLALTTLTLAAAYTLHVVDEDACTTTTAYFFLHACWHILSAYAIGCFLAVLIYLRSLEAGGRASILWYGYLLPWVEIMPKEHSTEMDQLIILD